MPKPEQFRRPDPHDQRRTVALEATVGSDVYNLRVEGSDLDWVHYVFPTLDDLYDRQQVSYERAADGDDHKYRDVRHLAHLVKKVNLNTLEMLYSPRLVVHPSLAWLVDERDRFASLDLPRLYDSMTGTFRQHTDKLMKSLGAGARPYDTKAYMHLHRLTHLAETYAADDFTSLRRAVRYPDGSDACEQLTALRRGVHTLDEALAMLPSLGERFDAMRDAYYARPPGDAEEATLREMEARVRQAVLAHLERVVKGDLA